MTHDALNLNGTLGWCLSICNALGDCALLAVFIAIRFMFEKRKLVPLNLLQALDATVNRTSLTDFHALGCPRFSLVEISQFSLWRQ